MVPARGPAVSLRQPDRERQARDQDRAWPRPRSQSMDWTYEANARLASGLVHCGYKMAYSSCLLWVFTIDINER